jgi:hypothetical protein
LLLLLLYILYATLFSIKRFELSEMVYHSQFKIFAHR